MLRLKTTPTESFWLEILPAQMSVAAKGKAAQITVPAQRTQFRPFTMSMLLVARDAGGAAILAALPKLPDGAPPGAAIDMKLADAKGRVALSVAIAQLAIVAWEGVGDADGAPIAPTPENIAAYLSDWRVYDAVQRLYVEPAIASIDEKNASAPSRTGTSGAAKGKRIARGAGNSTEKTA